MAEMLPDCDEPIRVFITSDRGIIRLGLRGIAGRAADIAIVGESSVDDAIRFMDMHEADLIVIDTNGNRCIEDIAPLLQDRRCPPGVVVIGPPYFGIELIRRYKQAAVSACSPAVSPQGLVMAIRSANNGGVFLDAEIAGAFLANLRQETLNSSSISDAGVADGKTLTEREREVLRLIARGRTNQQIASDLFISVATTKAHVRSILSKLSVSDRTQAAVHAATNGLV